MLQHLFSFIGVGFLSALLAVATIIGNAMRIDKDPASDGPRALKAQFFGIWVAFSFLAWSFMFAAEPTTLWILRGIAATAAVLGFTMAAYFAGTPEVRVRLDEPPSGFENPITALELDSATVAGGPDETARGDRSWSELNTQRQG